ncbi:hypothetical protein FBUS_10479 [Fasciolopsis buskii]|uniref:Uncharacterized protein n=1 Tax=Fasciolopsis buskii TaxID=27845 RepID=A0A8E0RT93_9TREM|nr:hypothetical protein FBUS_10479 [Fasciolopsis buski]
MSTLRNKPSISPLVLSGTSSPNDASVAAGDSYFGSGSTDSACMVVDSTPVLRSSKSDELISVLTEATVLLRRCCPRSRLPVSSAEGILRFPLKHNCLGYGVGSSSNKNSSSSSSSSSSGTSSSSRSVRLPFSLIH